MEGAYAGHPGSLLGYRLAGSGCFYRTGKDLPTADAA